MATGTPTFDLYGGSGQPTTDLDRRAEEKFPVVSEDEFNQKLLSAVYDSYLDYKQRELNKRVIWMMGYDAGASSVLGAGGGEDWISVHDCNLRDGDRVLCLTESGYMCIGYLLSGAWHSEERGKELSKQGYTVTHYRQLPYPPKPTTVKFNSIK